MLGTFKVGTWCRAIFTLRRCGRSRCIGIHIALVFLARTFSTAVAATFTAVTAVTVTRAALTALASVFRARSFSCRWVFLAFSSDHFGSRGVDITGSDIALAVVATAFAAFTALTSTFAAALAAFTAAFAAWRTFIADFGAFGIQLWHGIAAAFVFAVVATLTSAIAATFAGRAFASRALCAFAAFSTLTTCRTGFAFAQFAAAFSASFAAAFTTATTFARCTDFAVGTFAAFASAATAAAIATPFTAFAVTALTALAVTTFAGFFVLFAHSSWRCFRGAATKQILQPTEETTGRSRSDLGGFGG